MRRKCSGRTCSPTSRAPATTTSTAPTARGHSSGSPRSAIASVAAKSGAVPTTTDAREEPASRIASVKSICETPGASSPASAKTASSLGRASSPVPGSTTAPTATTRRATAVVATAPVSASGCARSATRRATVIAPKRKAETSASRTAATAGAPYSAAGEVGEARRSTPKGGGSQLPRRGDGGSPRGQTPSRKGKGTGAPMRRGQPGANFPLETGLAASPVFVFLGIRAELVGDELEQAAVGIAEVHARADAAGSETLHRAELHLDAVALQVGDRLGGGPRPDKAEIAVARADGQACDVARHVDAG